MRYDIYLNHDSLYLHPPVTGTTTRLCNINDTIGEADTALMTMVVRINHIGFIDYANCINKACHMA